MVLRNPEHWRLDQFNLICYGSANHPIFENPAGPAEFWGGRMFEFTAPEIKDHYAQDISQLMYLPTVVVAELGSGSRLGNPVPARFTQISNVRRVSNSVRRARIGDVVFDYRHLDDTITSEAFFNSNLFDATGDLSEKARTHWAVKEGDLIGWIAEWRKEQAALAKPRFFEVDQWPMPKRHDVAVMMPFQAEFDPVYQAIKSACAREGAKHLRVDEIYKPSKIADDIFAAIVQSRLVICDLTGKNPNVLYEVGLAHARNIPVIMISQNGDDVPFDLRHIRYFTYLNNGEGLQQLQDTLKLAIRECLRE